MTKIDSVILIFSEKNVENNFSNSDVKSMIRKNLANIFLFFKNWYLLLLICSLKRNSAYFINTLKLFIFALKICFVK